MVLDECTPYPCELAYVRNSVDLTYRWARRCREAHDHPYQSLFAIVQGGTWPEERRHSAELTVELDFPGYGIGGFERRGTAGVDAGDPGRTGRPSARGTAALPHGVGDPEGIVEAVALGVDMFDSVLPTRLARNGSALTRQGPAQPAQLRPPRRPCSPGRRLSVQCMQSFGRSLSPAPGPQQRDPGPHAPDRA